MLQCHDNVSQCNNAMIMSHCVTMCHSVSIFNCGEQTKEQKKFGRNETDGKAKKANWEKVVENKRTRVMESRIVIKSVNQSFDKTKTHVKDFWDVSIRGLHIGPGELGPEGFYLQKNIVI